MTSSSQTIPTGDRNDEIQIYDLHKSFGDVEVLKGISLTVHSGEVVCVIGPSGSGKSTLIRCINRLETIDAGTIRFEGTPLPAEGATGSLPLPRAFSSARRCSLLRSEPTSSLRSALAGAAAASTLTGVAPASAATGVVPASAVPRTHSTGGFGSSATSASATENHFGDIVLSTPFSPGPTMGQFSLAAASPG